MELETVEQIVALLSEYPVSEISVEQDGLRVVARKPLTALGLPPQASALPAETEEGLSLSTALEEAIVVAPEPVLLTAGLVGLFRHREPPVGYGATLTAGQIVGSIEAMKVLNDVRAEASGQVVDVFVEEGAPVEYGQPLFRLMPSVLLP